MSRQFYLRIAIVCAAAAGLVFAVGTYFRIGFDVRIFFREMIFGIAFTLFVWWYNVAGFPALQKRFFAHTPFQTARLERILSTLTLSFLVVWLDERLRFLQVDQDLVNYKNAEFANEFRAVITAGILLLLIFLLDTSQKLLKTNTENQRLQLENSQAKFEILKQQVNPHFLFNSLNILKTMVKSADAKTEEFIIRLSEFYRSTLLTNVHDQVTLEEELRIIEHYIFMLKARFGDKLIVEEHIDAAHLKDRLPPFTLQLLIENCIKHNVVSEDKPLRIELFTEDHTLVVRNNLQQKRSVEAGSRTGLQNISSRLLILTGQAIQIELTATHFTVQLPLIPHARLPVSAHVLPVSGEIPATFKRPVV